MLGSRFYDEPVDDYLPQNGNRGYRVSRYELELDYKVGGNRLAGRAAITAVTIMERPRFSLDLAQALAVSEVLVNGSSSVEYTHQHGKLTVTPKQQIPAGGILQFVVQYAGTPKPVRGPWGEVGWAELTEGALVASQPNGAGSWFPCDDHPSAKASYRISITTDTPYYTLANGTLIGKQTKAGRTTWTYEQAEPMASYLATVQIGRYRRHRMSAAYARVPMYAVIPAQLRTAFEHDFGRQPEMMQVFSELFGPYPFRSYAVVVTEDELEIPIEAQGISIFGANHCDGRGGAQRLAAHELAHQWFGNSLTLRRWRDIWLHEGFACYAEWLWSQAAGAPSTDRLARAAWHTLHRRPQNIAAGDPGPGSMFDDRVYKRGALALHALRLEVGDTAFFLLLREWTARHRHASVTTEEFIDLAGHYSTTPLHALWQEWLYDEPLPQLPPAGGRA